MERLPGVPWTKIAGLRPVALRARTDPSDRVLGACAPVVLEYGPLAVASPKNNAIQRPRTMQYNGQRFASPMIARR